MPVLLITGAANRDERAYDDPDVFDIDRTVTLPLGLGHGIHACLGAAESESVFCAHAAGDGSRSFDERERKCSPGPQALCL